MNLNVTSVSRSMPLAYRSRTAMSSTGITLDSVTMNLESAGSMTAARISTGRPTTATVDPAVALVNDSDKNNNNNNHDDDKDDKDEDDGINGTTAIAIGPRVMVGGGGGCGGRRFRRYGCSRTAETADEETKEV
ncbi:Uncharacterized protein FWK35_00017143 [Aphis craccivora]|uniref:Uncharacterized protein n=1 Tax=Aphis craccivora TaxID=307492 RepID=A0A6G0YQI0_APHCR|nr:Uncharacterized protein FWK35_00017143 [Aphis craccivora]